MTPFPVSLSIRLRRLLALWLLSISCLPAAQAMDLGRDFSRWWPTAGEGAVASETRATGNFRGVKLDTDARVVIRQGERNGVVVEAEGNVLPLIDTHVEDGTLVVEDNRHFKSSSAKVVITARRLTHIGAGGSTTVVAEGLQVPELSLSLGGSSALSLSAVSVTRLTVALGGSSALKMAGTADELSLSLGGSAAVQAEALEAQAVSVSGGGSAQALVWARESLRVAAGGSVGVRYYGAVDPALTTAGSVTVRRLGDAPPRQP